jgi:hypothetical protein
LAGLLGSAHGVSWLLMPFPLTLTPGSQFGPLPADFRYDLQTGYTALVGPNNAGKSALLQLAYRTLLNEAEFGLDRVALVLPDRDYVNQTTQPGGRRLATWNGELVSYLQERPLGHGESYLGPVGSASPPTKRSCSVTLLSITRAPDFAACCRWLPR